MGTRTMTRTTTRTARTTTKTMTRTTTWMARTTTRTMTRTTTRTVRTTTRTMTRTTTRITTKMEKTRATRITTRTEKTRMTKMMIRNRHPVVDSTFSAISLAENDEKQTSLITVFKTNIVAFLLLYAFLRLDPTLKYSRTISIKNLMITLEYHLAV